MEFFTLKQEASFSVCPYVDNTDTGEICLFKMLEWKRILRRYWGIYSTNSIVNIGQTIGHTHERFPFYTLREDTAQLGHANMFIYIHWQAHYKYIATLHCIAADFKK